MIRKLMYERRRKAGANAQQSARFEGWYLFNFFLLYERQISEWTH